MKFTTPDISNGLIMPDYVSYMIKPKYIIMP